MVKILRIYNLRERFRTIFREHSGNYVNDNIELGLISSGNIDEDIFCVERYLAVFRIDDGRH